MLLYLGLAIVLAVVIWSGYRNFKLMNPKLTDQEMLDVLAAEGADMSAKHRFDFYIEFKSKESVEQAKLLLADDGYLFEVDDEDGGIIDFSAYLNMVPTLKNAQTHGARIADVARQTGGNYEEWSFEILNDSSAELN